MDDDELMTIGRFSHISGLSVHTLRHYDDIGVLSPVDVDPDSGYRRYRRDQVQTARSSIGTAGVRQAVTTTYPASLGFARCWGSLAEAVA